MPMRPEGTPTQSEKYTHHKAKPAVSTDQALKNISPSDMIETMKLFKNRWFHRWARSEGISDDVLRDAATEVIAGQVEADLGGYLFKKRLARAGGGKSGGYRTIIGYRRMDSKRLIFLYAFSKNARANMTDREKSVLTLTATGFLAATDQQIQQLLADGAIFEVSNA